MSNAMTTRHFTVNLIDSFIQPCLLLSESCSTLPPTPRQWAIPSRGHKITTIPKCAIMGESFHRHGTTTNRRR
jgi:hypothetical protein